MMGWFAAGRRRRDVVLTAVACLPAMIIIVLAAAHPAPPEHVYLFDCEGNVRHLVDDAPVEGSGTRVSAVDTTLPDRVRDGCAILAGWYDIQTDQLALRVQLHAWADTSGTIPTKLLWLTSALERAPDRNRSSPAPSRPDAHTVRAAVRSIESPFARSVGYVSPDGTMLLLKELGPSSGTRTPGIVLDFGWHAGTTELDPSTWNATGRYALFDLASGTQRGAVVSVTRVGSDDRVVCITPAGRIYLATARDTLTVLDVAEPGNRTSLEHLGLDLYWTACATR
jgi:hypothetical protein